MVNGGDPPVVDQLVPPPKITAADAVVGENWLRCGQCLHYCTCDATAVRYWCTNPHCPQTLVILPYLNVATHYLVHTSEVA